MWFSLNLHYVWSPASTFIPTILIKCNKNHKEFIKHYMCQMFLPTKPDDPLLKLFQSYLLIIVNCDSTVLSIFWKTVNFLV